MTITQNRANTFSISPCYGKFHKICTSHYSTPSYLLSNASCHFPWISTFCERWVLHFGKIPVGFHKFFRKLYVGFLQKFCEVRPECFPKWRTPQRRIKLIDVQLWAILPPTYPAHISCVPQFLHKPVPPPFRRYLLMTPIRTTSFLLTHCPLPLLHITHICPLQGLVASLPGIH